VLLSLITEAVRPAADEPFPEVYTATGAVFSTNLRNFTGKEIIINIHKHACMWVLACAHIMNFYHN
jgi:hypothetical protein